MRSELRRPVASRTPQTGKAPAAVPQTLCGTRIYRKLFIQERKEKVSIKCPKCGAVKDIVKNIPDAYGREYRKWSFCKHCSMLFSQFKGDSKQSSPSVPIRTKTIADKAAIPFAIHSAIVDALDHAKTKHPHFADTDAEAGTVIAEELLEVNTAALKVMQGINDQASRDNLFEELAQLNATTIRMMEKLLK
jgi:rubredoxin